MALAIAGGNIDFRSFPGNTAANIIDTLTLSLTSCAWTDVTSVTGGNRLTAVSPQGLNIYLFIRSLGHRRSLSFNQTVTLNFQTIDGTIHGQDQELEINVLPYQVVSGMCQLAVAQTGGSGGGGSNFIGGIPYVKDATACGLQIPTLSVNQAFWSMGDFIGGAPPRNYLIKASSQENCEALWNTDYSPGGNVTSSLRIPALTPAPDIAHGFNYPSPTRWYVEETADQETADYFAYEPLLCWGLTAGNLAKVRAQAYDCFVSSKKQAKDVPSDYLGFRWINWTDNYLFGGLNLRIPGGGSGSIPHNHSAIAT